MALIANTLSSLTEMQRLLSTVGVTEFADHDDSGAADTDVVEDCINQATEEMRMYCWRYADDTLATSTLANRWATVLACYFLTTRRGNPPPDSLAMQYGDVMAKLELVRIGTLKLPGIATKANYSPAFSNLIIDRRWPDSRVRRVAQNSDQIATQLTRKDADAIPIE